jgi:hypothetical protein
MMKAFIVMSECDEPPLYNPDNSSYQENFAYENNEDKSKPAND